MHEILSFMKSFSANFNSRFCKSHKSNSAIQTKEQNSLLRTKANYVSDLIKNDVKETGLLQACVFNALPSFQVTNNLAVDIMHDLYEIVCHYDFAQVLLYFIDKQYFTRTEFNERKSLFDYGSSGIGNISKPIKANHFKKKFNSSASEMRCLIHYTTLIIGEKIPRGDVVWRFFTKLVQITDILTKTFCTDDDLKTLSTLKMSHHSFYVSFFKKIHLIQNIITCCAIQI